MLGMSYGTLYLFIPNGVKRVFMQSGTTSFFNAIREQIDPCPYLCQHTQNKAQNEEKVCLAYNNFKAALDYNLKQTPTYKRLRWMFVPHPSVFGAYLAPNTIKKTLYIHMENIIRDILWCWHGSVEHKYQESTIVNCLHTFNERIIQSAEVILQEDPSFSRKDITCESLAQHPSMKAMRKNFAALMPIVQKSWVRYVVAWLPLIPLETRFEDLFKVHTYAELDGWYRTSLLETAQCSDFPNRCFPTYTLV